MRISNWDIGPGQLPYLIAEAGSNHSGKFSAALQLIRMAAQCGAGAVKFQFWSSANVMVTHDHPDYGTYVRHTLPIHWLNSMRHCARAHKIDLFYSVFHPDDVAVLERYDPPAYKIASAELTYDALLLAAAATGKPVIISTGMSTEAEMRHAAAVVADSPSEVVMLHCVSAYPAPPEDMNLRYLRGNELTWGLSDHSADPFAAPLMAVAFGASIIEKHFTLDRRQEGPDHHFAIEPHELKALATSLHQAHMMIGDGDKRVMPSEATALSDRRTLQDGRWLRGMPK